MNSLIANTQRAPVRRPYQRSTRISKRSTRISESSKGISECFTGIRQKPIWIRQSAMRIFFRLACALLVLPFLASCQPEEAVEPSTPDPAPLPQTSKQKYYMRGYINKTGKFVIPPQFIIANSFSEGLAHVCDPRGSYIDKTGKFVIDKPYYVGGDFHEGLAWVAVPKTKWSDVNRPGDQLLYGFIDKTGKLVIPAKYRFVGDFSEGLALVMPQGAEKMGFIDKTGNMVIAPKYVVSLDSNQRDLPQFHHGTAVVTTDKDKDIYIDKNDRPVSSKQISEYEHLMRLDDDQGLEHFEEEGMHGFKDRNGRIVIPKVYPKAKPFHDGLAAVRVDDKRWGFIDRSRKMVIAPDDKYEYGNFSEGLCVVRPCRTEEIKALAEKTDWKQVSSDEIRKIKVPERGGECGFIDKTGKLVIPMKYETAEDFKDGLALVELTVDEGQVKQKHFPFEYSVDNNTLIFPLKLNDTDDKNEP